MWKEVSFRKNRLKLRRIRIEEAARQTGSSQGNCDRGLGKPSRFGLARRRQRILDKKRERTYGYCSSSTTVLWLRGFHLFEVLEEENRG